MMTTQSFEYNTNPSKNPVAKITQMLVSKVNVNNTMAKNEKA